MPATPPSRALAQRLTATWSEYRALDGRIWLLAAVRGASTMGLSLVMAFMTIYLVSERGASGSLYGSIYFVANLAQAVAQGYAGELSDRVGRRPLMVVTMLLRTVVLALLGWQILAAAPLWLLALSLIVSSALRGGFEPVAYALVADIAAPEQRVTAFGLQRMGTNFGWAIGPALGGALAQSHGYGPIFFWAAGVLAVAAVATAQLREVPRPKPEPTASVSLGKALRLAAANRPLMWLLLVTLLIALTHVQLFSTMSVFAEAVRGFDTGDIGVLYTVNGVAVLALQVPALTLIRRIGTRRALMLGPLAYIVGFIAIGSDSGLFWLGVAVFVVTIGEVIIAPAHQAAAAELGDPARMGRAFGLVGLVMMVGVALAPLVGGIAFDALRTHPPVMWLLLAGLPLALGLAARGFAAALARRDAVLAARAQ